MKKILLYVLGVVAVSATFTFQSCNKLKDAIPAQDVSFTEGGDITISPASDTTQQLALGQISLSYNLDSMIKAQTDQKLGFSNIQSVKIASIKLTLNDATTTNNFANFSQVSAAFNSDINGDIYTVTNIPSNPDSYSSELTPAVTDASQDIKKYFNSQMTFNYLMSGKLRRATTTTLHCHVEITYTISVKA